MSGARAWRLFVALHPPPETAGALLAVIDAAAPADARRVPPEQVHLTVQFIGDTAERDLPETAESVERACAGVEAFTLTPLRLATFPLVQQGRAPRQPPRLIAAITDAPASLLELQRRLAHRFARSVRDRAGDRFVPHITLARFREPTRAERFDLPLRDPPAASFVVERVRLMRSVLTAAGARHDEVASVRLRGGAGPASPTAG